MHTLNALPGRDPRRVNVFQLVRMLRWPGAGPGVRFAADLSAGFPGREVTTAAAQGQDEHGPVTLTTHNFCLAGTLGPLPEPFLEWLREQARRNDPAAARFLDIFNQRLNVLRHDLKARQVPELANEAPEQTEHAEYLAALMGLGLSPLARQVDLPPRAWLALAGVLGNVRRSARTIGRLLALVYKTGVTVEQMIGAWQPVEAPDRMALGRRNHRLGRGTVLGRRVWDQQARVRITLAGLPYRQAVALLPPERGRDASPAHLRLSALVRLLLDRRFDCEMRLGVQARTVPPATLSARPDREAYAGLRLGQTAWLGRVPHQPAAPFLISAEPAREAA